MKTRSPWICLQCCLGRLKRNATNLTVSFAPSQEPGNPGKNGGKRLYNMVVVWVNKGYVHWKESASGQGRLRQKETFYGIF